MLTKMKEILLTRIDSDYVYVSSNRKRKKIILSDIRFVESCREYIKIYTVAEIILIKCAISSFSQVLPEKKFLRVHRCFIVSSQYIIAYDSKYIYGNDFKLPIGRTYKKKVVGYL